MSTFTWIQARHRGRWISSLQSQLSLFLETLELPPSLDLEELNPLPLHQPQWTYPLPRPQSLEPILQVAVLVRLKGS